LPLLEELIGNASTYRELQEGHVRDVYRTCRELQKKLIFVVSYEAGEVAGESDTVDLLSILDFVNQRLQNIRQAIELIKRQGGGPHIKSMLQQQSAEQPVDLLDLGDDFLSMPESNPLDKLDKFEAGRREERKEPVQTAPSPDVTTPAVTESSRGLTTVEPPRQEPAFIDLLEWDTPQVSAPKPAAEEDDFFASLASRKIGT
jgi:hypothetical protein